MESQIMAQNALVEVLKKKYYLDMTDAKTAEQLESARLVLRYVVIDMARQGDKKAERLVGDELPVRRIVNSLKRWPHVV